MSLSGYANVGTATLGLNTWINDADDVAETTGFYASAGFTVTDALTLSAGYVSTTTDLDGGGDTDSDAVNVAASYTVSDVVTVQGDIKDDGDDTYFFLAAYYDF